MRSRAKDGKSEASGRGLVTAHIPPGRKGPSAGGAILLAVLGLVAGYWIGSRYDSFFVPVHGITGALVGLAFATATARLSYRLGTQGTWRLLSGWEEVVVATRQYLSAGGEGSRPSGFSLHVGARWWAVITPVDMRPSVLIEVKNRDDLALMLTDLAVRDARCLRLPVRRGGWGILADVGLLLSIAAYGLIQSLPRQMSGDFLLKFFFFVLPLGSILATLIRPLFNKVSLLELDRGDSSFVVRPTSLLLGRRAYIEEIAVGAGSRATLTVSGTGVVPFHGKVGVSLLDHTLAASRQLELFETAQGRAGSEAPGPEPQGSRGT